MALGTPTDGGAAYLTGNGNIAVPYPASIGANDVLVLIVGQKPSTANGGTVTTPSGWTLRDSKTAAGGYGTTLGIDTGNTNLYFYTKDSVTGSETGNLSVTVGTSNVSWGLIVLVPTDSSNITYGFADGERTTAPTQNVAFTNALTNGSTATNFASGDMAIFAMNIATDNGNASFSLPTITATGATFGTPVKLEEPDSSGGQDIAAYVAYASVTAGSSTTAPTVGATYDQTTTNVRGPIVCLRIREVAAVSNGKFLIFFN